MNVLHQKKKNPNDPDVDQLNPEIVAMAKRYGFIRGAMNLFLHGDVTWLEALELMVISVSKEYREQNKILISALQERGPSTTLALNNPLLTRALPATPLPAPVQRLAGASPQPSEIAGEPQCSSAQIPDRGDRGVPECGAV